MNWTIEFIDDRSFVTVITEGDFSLENHKSMIEEIISHKFWKPGSDILFDHRKLNFGYTDIDFMRQASQNHEQNDDRIGAGKAAILMKSVADYGRGRQFELIASDKVSAKLKIFLEEKNALDWLIQ